MAPVAALFILLIFQFSVLFSDVVREVAHANAKAATALREWEVENARRGFARPCLERMENTAFSSDNRVYRIGAGKFSYDFTAPQEVRVVTGQICIP